jgi:hypothetical protein
MTTTEDDEIRADTEELLAMLGGGLPQADRESVEDFLEVGEYELALDTLCVQMNERSITPTELVYSKLLELLRKAGMDLERYRAFILPPREPR